MPAILLTGFPGFLGSELIGRLLNRNSEDVEVVCIVQNKFKRLAAERAAAVEREDRKWTGRIRLLEGDITAADLDLGGEYDRLARETREIYHLAAVYDLAVRREIGMRVNVDGTRHVLRFAEKCARLNRFQYVSTCYVSGRYPGTFTENDLEKGQVFNNHYEETKFLAEVEVQKLMGEGLPTTIYRPAIVVGNSETGKTQKYDGPYYLIQWILRQRHYAIVPTIGDTRRFRVNVVPSDFIVDAFAHLSQLPEARNKVYQLCDPDPPTVDQLLDTLAAAADRTLLRVPLPKIVAKGALAHVPGVHRIMRIEPEAIEYFVHPTTYSCDNALRDLAGAQISCPSFGAYAGTLVAFMKSHPDVSSSAMT